MSRPLLYPTKVVRDRYQVQDLAGRGAFGDVWACVDKLTGRHVACKVIDVAHLSRQEDIWREVSSLRKLSGSESHSDVLRLNEVLEHRNKVQIVTELCTGGDLFKLIRITGSLPAFATQRVFKQLASAVQVCHSEVILHQDIKPENILFETQPSFPRSGVSTLQAKQADFGLAVPLRGQESVQGFRGTRFYAAPEVVVGESYGFPTDMWSLGAVLFVMLTGWLSAVGDDGEHHDPTWQVVIGRISTSDDRVLPTVPPQAYDLLRQLLQEDPLSRPTAEELLRHPWLQEQEPPVPTQRYQGPIPRDCWEARQLQRQPHPADVLDFPSSSDDGMESCSSESSLSSLSKSDGDAASERSEREGGECPSLSFEIELGGWAKSRCRDCSAGPGLSPCSL